MLRFWRRFIYLRFTFIVMVICVDCAVEPGVHV